jgi:cysteine synthase
MPPDRFSDFAIQQYRLLFGDGERYHFLSQSRSLTLNKSQSNFQNVGLNPSFVGFRCLDYRGHFTGDPHSMSSIGGDTVTYQSLHAVQESGGIPVTVSNEQAMQAKHELAQAGLFVELSVAASLAALYMLQSRTALPPDADVLLVLTSSGYKDVKTGYPVRRREVS